MSSRRRARSPALLAALLFAGTSSAARPEDAARREEYRRLVELYRTGDAEAAAASLASWPARDLARATARAESHGRLEDRSAAVLDLHAAALALGSGREKEAAALIDAGVVLVGRPGLGGSFAPSWQLAAGYLLQSFGDRARAFRHYAAALALRPGDPEALLARATALEFSALPDGFGGIVVADRDVWPFLAAGGVSPAELSALLHGGSKTPYGRFLLESLTRQYRDVLARDSSLAEARLRLGRVLVARGHRDEGAAELRTIASTSTDPFLAAIAHLCLARLAGEGAEAVAEYRAAVQAQLSLNPAWVGLSHALLGQGDREAARAALERAFVPEGGRSLNAWVVYHLGRGRAFLGALAGLQAAVAADR